MKSLVCLFLVLLTLPLYASTYYVDAILGSDKNPGSQNQPWATIQHGVDNIQPNDVLVLLSDFNLTSTVVIQTNTITVTSLAGRSTSYPDVYSTSQSVAKLFEIKSNSVTIKCIEFTQAYQWGLWVYGDYCRIENCVLTQTRKSAIVIQGDHNYIGYNRIFDIGDPGIQNANGIDVESYRNIYGFHTADYNTIEHNQIFNNLTHFAVNMFPDPGSSMSTDYMTGNIIQFNYIDGCYGGIYMRCQKEFLIYSNVILNSILGHSSSSDTNGNAITFDSHPNYQNVFDCDGGKIYNNIIATTFIDGLRNIYFTDIVIKNNLFYNVGDHFVATNQNTNVSFDYNYYYNENSTHKWKWVSTSCPTFDDWKSASQGDTYGSNDDPTIRESSLDKFYQIVGSNMIDAAATLTGVESKDINGNERGIGDGWDIGAYEFFDYTAPIVSSAAVVPNFLDSLTFSCTELIYDVHFGLNLNYYSIANNSTSQRINITNIKQGTTVGLSTDENHIPGNNYRISFTSGVQDTNGNSVTPTSLTYTAPIYKAQELLVTNSYSLSQNYPNPFNPVTIVSYSLKSEGFTNLEIFNIVGERVKTIVNEFQQPGDYKVTIDATDLGSGIYIYKLQAGTFIAIRKMSLLK